MSGEVAINYFVIGATRIEKFRYGQDLKNNHYLWNQMKYFADEIAQANLPLSHYFNCFLGY
jgi:hypothetical protein